MPIPCYTDPMDKEFVIMYQENQIHIQKAEHEFLLESSLASLYTSSSLFLESDPYDMEFDDDDSDEDEEEEKKDGKKVGIFTKICNAIKSFINSFIKMLQNMTKDSVDGFDDYKKTETFKVRYNQDVERITDEVMREMVKGRKIIQAISKRTGIDDVTVANYCDLGSKIVMQNKDQIVDSANKMIIKNRVINVMNKSKDIVDESDKSLSNAKLSKKETEQGMRVLKTMNQMITGLGKSSKGLFSKFNKKKK